MNVTVQNEDAEAEVQAEGEVTGGVKRTHEEAKTEGEGKPLQSTISKVRSKAACRYMSLYIYTFIIYPLRGFSTVVLWSLTSTNVIYV